MGTDPSPRTCRNAARTLTRRSRPRRRRPRGLRRAAATSRARLRRGRPFALERLKQRAERLGADAVVDGVDVELHHGEPGGEPSHLSATALRFRDLLQAGAYGTIGELPATADVGDEAPALRHLREQARAVGRFR